VAARQTIDEAGQLRAQVVALTEQLGQERNNTEILSESIADLERALIEPGWVRMLAQGDIEFAPDAMVQMRAICRLFAIKNPLIKRGLGLRSAYVWGGGLEITARANGKEAGEQDVQAVVNTFLDDPGNMRAVTGAEARDQLERSGLGTEGEVFMVCFTRPVTGEVSVRTISPDEIVDVICNPDDYSEPWYYLRRWTEDRFDTQAGTHKISQREQYYPCIDYIPKSRPSMLGQVAVRWDAPVLHVAANRPRGWKRGLPDSYAAVDWSRAYKEFLEDWARLMKALSRYAWKATTPGKAATQVKAKIAQAPSVSDFSGTPNAAGSTVILSPDAALEAINKSGATIDSESGRPLAMMVASALGVPVTMLLADPGQTGARATAETLDRPTELEMTQRRELWGGVYLRLIRFVIARSTQAPSGLLQGKATVDEYGRENVVLAGDTDQTVDVVWPELDDSDPAAMVESITKAAGVGVIPPEVLLRLFLNAFGVRNADALVESMIDEDGTFIWPSTPPMGGQGGAAANLARNGGDAATAGPGPMTPDEEPPPEGEE
jgi:hypothetical protein